MTVDEENSIYVGGLPYSATEDTLRRIFDYYGAIIAVKIINDRSTRGKCYGFVTFRNPRSVVEAIDDMNGKTIDGRAVRVNGVTTRGGRPNFGREQPFQRDVERRMDWDGGRDRERDYDEDRDRYYERYSDRSRERDRSWDPDEDREREYEHDRDRDRAAGDGYLDRDQMQDRMENEQDLGRAVDWNWEGGRDSGSLGRETNGGNDENRIADKNQFSKKPNGSAYHERSTRDISFEHGDDYDDDEVKAQLGISIRRHEDLKNEISVMEESLGGEQDLASGLQKKAKKLEDELVSAKRRTSQRKAQLAKLYKCYMQMNDYTERLKSTELELQTLVDSTLIESDMGDELVIRDGN
ncbi:Cold-inducible RNA-binding protein [Linum grandiflorum]